MREIWANVHENGFIPVEHTTNDSFHKRNIQKVSEPSNFENSFKLTLL